MAKRADCFICGKENLPRNAIGINEKLIGHNVKKFNCMQCLAYLITMTEITKTITALSL